MCALWPNAAPLRPSNKTYGDKKTWNVPASVMRHVKPRIANLCCNTRTLPNCGTP